MWLFHYGITFIFNSYCVKTINTYKTITTKIHLKVLYKYILHPFPLSTPLAINLWKYLWSNFGWPLLKVI